MVHPPARSCYPRAESLYRTHVWLGVARPERSRTALPLPEARHPTPGDDKELGPMGHPLAMRSGLVVPASSEYLIPATGRHRMHSDEPLAELVRLRHGTARMADQMQIRRFCVRQHDRHRVRSVRSRPEHGCRHMPSRAAPAQRISRLTVSSSSLSRVRCHRASPRRDRLASTRAAGDVDRTRSRLGGSRTIGARRTTVRSSRPQLCRCL